jgi:hypothetical protein
MIVKHLKPKEDASQRKYKLALLSFALITLGFVLAAQMPGVSEVYTTFISAIIGMNFVYAGANVGNKWVIGKNLMSSGGEPPAPESAPKKETLA